eukprot:g13198.t1
MYEFFPGSGAHDDLHSNIINAPLAPFWKSKDGSHGVGHRGGSGGGAHGTRSRTSSRAKQEHGGGGGGGGGVGDADHRGGRACYREAIVRRLLPALRAFNPSLIMLSAGFDAAKGDVGNCKQGVRSTFKEGIDLTADDYLWTTEKIQSVADICCEGKIVSVLEGGYGQHQCDSNSTHGHNQGHGQGGAAGLLSSMTRLPASSFLFPAPGYGGYARGNGSSAGAASARGYQVKSTAQSLQRHDLANNVAAHVRGLVDPYQSRVTEEAEARMRQREAKEVPEPDRKKGRVGR